MPRGQHRKFTSSAKEIIDVDAFHSRYEDPDGLVQLSSAEEFRASHRTRHQNSRPASVDRKTVVAENTERRRSTSRRDIPSTLGPSIRKAMSQKHSQSSEPAGSSNRQRNDAGPSREGAVTNNIRHHSRTPSPDLMIIDERPRQPRSFPTMSNIRQELPSTLGPSVQKAIAQKRTQSFESIDFDHPNKRQRNDSGPSFPIPTNIPPNKSKSFIAASSLILKQSTSSAKQPETESMDVIELFSDEETGFPYHESTPIPPCDDPPIEFSSESDRSDDDWDPPGLDLNDPDVWLPLPNNINKEDGLFHPIEDLSVCSPPPLPRYRCQDTSRWPPPPPPPKQPLYIWDKLRLAENLRWRPRPRPMLMHSKKLITRPKDMDFNLRKLESVTSFKQAPGTINAIEQSEGLIVIGSACDGGLADQPDEIPSPYNRSGALSVWSNNGLVILDGHSTRRGLQPKHYTINDVKFDPTSNSFASIGEDKKCRLWVLDTDSEESKWKFSLSFQYSSVPHSLAFRPGSSILAIAEKKVYICDLSEEVVMPPHKFPLHEIGSSHIIGSLAWGHEVTSDELFASSEPTLRTFTGAHKVFDLRTQKSTYQFDAHEAGDAISVDATGATLALCTQAETNRHILRLYDIRRRDPKAFTSLDLIPFSTHDKDNFEGEVNVATFSPDQLYLALARNDNHIHVYDRRMLGKWSSEPVFKYCHFGESKTVSKREVYGVVQALWLQSSWTTRTCLVTGGEDGCVRMWDPSTAAQDVENGKILAEVDYDISQFSIGDPFVREYRLVVGDASGRVTIFDHICG